MSVDVEMIERAARCVGELEALALFEPCPEWRGTLVAQAAELGFSDDGLTEHLTACLACATALDTLQARMRDGHGTTAVTEPSPVRADRPDASGAKFDALAQSTLVAERPASRSRFRRTDSAPTGRHTSPHSRRGVIGSAVTALAAGLALLVAVGVATFAFGALTGGGAHARRPNGARVASAAAKRSRASYAAVPQRLLRTRSRHLGLRRRQGLPARADHRTSAHRVHALGRQHRQPATPKPATGPTPAALSTPHVFTTSAPVRTPVVSVPAPAPPVTRTSSGSGGSSGGWAGDFSP